MEVGEHAVQITTHLSTCTGEGHIMYSGGPHTVQGRAHNQRGPHTGGGHIMYREGHILYRREAHTSQGRAHHVQGRAHNVQERVTYFTGEST